MPDYNVYNGGITKERISSERARELYEQAAANPDSDLDGSLEHGFHYWTIGADGGRRVRRHVMPVEKGGAESAGPSLPPRSV